MAKPFIRHDHLYQRAKEAGYRSRAAYKLLELDKKYRLLRRGSKVLDLGCFPGGWLQVALERVGPGGLVIGVDLKDVEPVEHKGHHALILKGDLHETSVRRELGSLAGGPVDVVLSDMSPQLSGIRVRDLTRSVELVELAFCLARELLKPSGAFVAKLFPGNESEELIRSLKPQFDSLSRVGLESTRKSSNEFYIIGRGYLGEVKT